jgi:hypothetical protein
MSEQQNQDVSPDRRVSAWGDLRSPGVIWIKGALFLVLGGLSAALLLARRLNWLDGVLLLATVWAFCRAYYFAFYVIQHYVDPGYRFSGLGSFVRYAVSRAPTENRDAPRSET